eukprot:g4245.t1
MDELEDTSFSRTSYKTIGPGPTLFHAEIGLLDSLSKPRISSETTNPYKNDDANNPNALHKQDLSQYRNDFEVTQKRREKLDAEESVRALNHQDYAPKQSSTGFKLLTTAYANRKSRHDDALKLYRKTVNQISEDIEHVVIDASRKLKDFMAQNSEALEAIFAKLDDDVFMTMQDHEYVKEAWNKLNSLNEKKFQTICDFDDSLVKIEDKRSQTIGDGLQTLLKKLFDVAYIGKGDVQRLIEAEALEVNLVILGNYRAHADLVAKLKNGDVKAKVACRHRWLRRQVAWRNLRHSHALKCFETLLASPRFTNPESRKQIFDNLKTDQLNKHVKQRLSLLRKLGTLLPPNIKVDEVKEIMKELERLANMEDEMNQSYFDQLNVQLEEMVIDAKQVREELRAELHDYQALALEGDKNYHANLIEDNWLRSKDFEDFFRKAGGLKSDLRMIVDSLRDPRIIYNDIVQKLDAKVHMLADATGIAEILEKQGKDGDRKALQATLEKLRVGKRADLVPIIPIFTKQMSNMQYIAGLPINIVNEIADCVSILDTAFPESFLRTYSSISRGGGSRGHSRSAAHTAATNRSAISTSTFGGTNIPGLAQLRSVQKRMGVIAYASDMPDSIKEELRELIDVCAKQAISNEKIDEVVEQISVGPIAKRREEHEELRKRVGIALEDQSAVLREASNRICKFYIQVASMLEKNNSANQLIDDEVADALTDRLDNFDEDHASLTKKFETARSNVRHAQNMNVCEKSMTKAVSFLDDIEDNYRNFYEESMKIAKTHPERTLKEELSFRDKYCLTFSLVEEDQMSDLCKKADDAYAMLKTLGKGKNSSQVKETTANGDEDGGEDEEESETKDKETVSEEEEVEDDHEGDTNAEEGEEAMVASGAEATDGEVSVETLEAIVDKYEAASQSPQLTFTGRVTYREAKTVDEICKEMVEVSDPAEEDEQDEEKASEEESAEQETGEPSDEISAEEKIDSAIDENIPRGPDGQHCMESLTIPMDLLCDMVKQLRDTLINETETDAATREKTVNELYKERAEDLTYDLEERLRTHWPRKGRTEVGFKQPRIGELIAHRKRHERQVRAVKVKLKAQEESFGAECVAARSSIDKYSQHQRALESVLIEQGNLAALQGILKTAKEATQIYKAECSDWLYKLAIYKDDEPLMLLDSNEKFLASCHTFENGGDYDEREIAHSRKKLKEIEKIVKNAIEVRNKEFSAIENAQVKALDHFAFFQESFEQNLQELSMREGLGQKYGAPRRNAQERLRSEMGRSDDMRNQIQETFRELKSLCEKAPAIAEPSTEEYNDYKEQHPDGIVVRASLSYRIKECLFRMRSLLYQRAKYLEMFKEEPGYEISMMAVSFGDDSEESKEYDPEDSSMPSDATFMKTFEQLDHQCREDTKELYAREGKGSEIPEKLRGYLREKKKESQTFRDESSKVYREQVKALTELLPIVATSCLADTLYRYRMKLISARLASEAVFREKLQDCHKQKEMNKAKLRPELASPNHEATLKTLCADEQTRSDNTRALIVEGRRAIVMAVLNQVETFEIAMRTSVENILRLFDSLIDVVDLKPLPGDEEIVPKRKSLRRLKKAREARLAREKRGEAEEIIIRMRRREWQRITKGRIVSELTAKFADVLKTTEDEKAEEEEQEVKSKKGKKGKSKAKEKEKKKGSSTDDDTATPEAETIASYYTPAQKGLLRNRDEVYELYSEKIREDTEKTVLKYTETLEGELLWSTNWNKMVQFLMDSAHDD